MLLGVTRELHGETLGPKMPPEYEKARKLDFLPPPFGTRFETFSIENTMKPARGPQTEFFSNYCHGILGLAQVGWQPAILKSSLGKSRQEGWPPAILIFRLLAAELGT